jgi:hypothetical protein
MIIFLDFDGVLHPDSVFKLPKKPIELRAAGALMMYAPVLEAVFDELDPDGKVGIVLSTSWVRCLGFSKTLKKMPSGLKNRVVGATWHSGMKKFDGRPYSRSADPFNLLPRWQQINWYVKRHQIQHWIAIDDLHSNTEIWPDDLRDHLVLTEGAKGLGCQSVQAELKLKLNVLMASTQYGGDSEFD